MGENGVLVFPDAAKGAASSIDPNLLLALQNGGGFNGNGAWIWILFLWMMWQNGGYNGYRNNGGSFQDLAAQINGNEGRQYLSEIMAGRFDNLGQLAQIVNTGVDTVKNGIFALQNAINQVGTQVGMYHFFDIVLNDIRVMEIDDETVKDVYRTMKNGKAKAVTISNISKHISLILFNFHSNKIDYINSIVHESVHVKQAMLEAYHVEDEGEAPAYTMGYLVSRMWEGFKQIL